MLTREVAVAGDISTHIPTKRMTRTLHGNQQRIVISTHILTKRMTFISTPFSGGNYISTHILTKRMTGTRQKDNRYRNYFNSHPHEEDDQFSKPNIFRHTISTHILTKRMTLIAEKIISKQFISTHILTKRMTVTVGIACAMQIHFNSHPHEEDDFDIPQ